MKCTWAEIIASAAERPAPMIMMGSELDVKPPFSTALSRSLKFMYYNKIELN